jgi:hypothetical protein
MIVEPLIKILKPSSKVFKVEKNCEDKDKNKLEIKINSLNELFKTGSKTLIYQTIMDIIDCISTDILSKEMKCKFFIIIKDNYDIIKDKVFKSKILQILVKYNSIIINCIIQTCIDNTCIDNTDELMKCKIVNNYYLTYTTLLNNKSAKTEELKKYLYNVIVDKEYPTVCKIDNQPIYWAIPDGEWKPLVEILRPFTNENPEKIAFLLSISGKRTDIKYKNGRFGFGIIKPSIAKSIKSTLGRGGKSKKARKGKSRRKTRRMTSRKTRRTH